MQRPCGRECGLATRTELDSARQPRYRAFLFVSISIVLFAASLRAWHIADRSLWLDEAIAANISRGTVAETLVLTRDLHSAPIVHPLILYAVEKVAADPLAVRLPSFVASMLAVVLILCLAAIPSIGQKTAALAALMLGVSAAQIRYAQEVREYSLSVLYAALLSYVFLSFSSNPSKRNSSALLYLTLFAAPLVQYGLALFSFGVLAAMLVLRLTDSDRRPTNSQILGAAGFLATGCLLSFVMTLRYQLGEPASYLESYYLTPDSTILRLFLSNTYHLLAFLLPGSAVALVLQARCSFTWSRRFGREHFPRCSCWHLRRLAPCWVVRFSASIPTVRSVSACFLHRFYACWQRRAWFK